MIILQVIGVFFLTAIADIIWVLYIKHISLENANKAGIMGVLIYFFAGLNIIGYTTNPWLLIPASVGAYLGTVLAIKFKKKKKE